MTLPWILHLWRTGQSLRASDRGAQLHAASLGAAGPWGAARSIQKQITAYQKAAGEINE